MLFFSIAAQSQTVNYFENYDNFTNPERGFYQYTITRSAGTPLSTYNVLTVPQLTGYKTAGMSLILRIFSLEQFTGTNTISTGYLANMQTDFTNMRAAGVKCIVRFSYADSQNLAICPIRDVALARMQAHIAQVAVVTSAYQDVISSVEAGFIGVWGEWAISQNFGDSSSATPLSTTDLQNRKTIGNQILQQIAPNRMVSFRTPRYQRLMLGLPTPTTITTPATVAAYAPRISAHNDCFLSSDTDEETYGTGGQTVAQDKTWLETKTRSTFNGGETCTRDSYNAPFNTQYTNASNAFTEMARFHFSYLNSVYHPGVVSSDPAVGLWVSTATPPTILGSTNYLEEIRKKLGYRFTLISSTLAPNNVTVNLKNVGFGNVFNPRRAFLVLRNAAGTVVNKIEMSGVGGTDVRAWNAAGITTPYAPVTSWAKNLTGYVCPGSYNLFVEIPDTDRPNDPNYSIRLANNNIGGVPVWDGSTGFNNLFRTINVTSLPTAVITGSKSACTESLSTRVSTNATTLLPGQTASWTIISGAGSITSTSTTTSSTATVNWTALPGTIKVTITIPGGCTVTQTQVIESICGCSCVENIVFNQAINVKGDNTVVINPSPTAEICDDVINYTWYWGDGTSTSNNSSGTHCYGASGNYTITIVATTDNGCTQTYNFGSITAAPCQTGGGGNSRIRNAISDNEIKIKPNPSKGIFNLVMNNFKGKATLQIFDMNGRIVYNATEQQFDNEREIDLTSFQSGIYILKIKGENIDFTEKLVKN